MLRASERRLRNLACFLTLAFLAAFTVSLTPSHAQETPWKRRLRTGVVVDEAPEPAADGPRGALTADEMRRLGLRPRGGGLVDLSYWPDEPGSPARVRPSELAEAMRELCPTSTRSSEIERYAAAIVQYSQEFAIDPWLLAALVYSQSDCKADIENSYGTGLTLLNVGMHAGNIRDGKYYFGVLSHDGWERKELDVSAFELRRDALLSPQANIYFAAALLNVFGQQCPQIDRAFDSVPHRHAVSHFVWGDRVADTAPEDRILLARRRLLNSHAMLKKHGKGLGGISFVSPLDGYPRIAISGLGEPRDNGHRLHQGIDFASELGEPVRSIAAGTVTFAGVDWERRAHIPLEPWGAVIVDQRHMGPRGLFVEVDHGNGVVSLYAHLASYDVEIGEQVDAGQRIGEVGRTGIRDSGPHLHFGLFEDGEVRDPLVYLAAYLFPPNLTKRFHVDLASAHRHPNRKQRSLRGTPGRSADRATDRRSPAPHF